MLAAFALLGAVATIGPATADQPYDRQVSERLASLESASDDVRAGAAEGLGFLRAYTAEEALLARLGDRSVEVRRQVAMALAWCGGRRSVGPLLTALDDNDWLTRQAACVSLTNLTGMEFPFAATAPRAQRASQARVWRDWWATVPPDRPPGEVLRLLEGRGALPGGWAATASTTYKGPPDVLLDGQIGPAYWQTKNVKPPQWLTVDLGRATEIAQVVIHQYGPGYCMTEYELATSLDGQQFEVIEHKKGVSPVELAVDFAPRKVRFVRITSFGSERPIYPTTFFEIEVRAPGEVRKQTAEPIAWRLERGVRALGALGGQGATEAILDALGPSPPTAEPYRPMVRAGIRSLGRLRHEAGFQALVGYLDNTMWARCAADALGDFGDRRAVPALLDKYPKFAKKLDGANPADVPADDRMGLSQRRPGCSKRPTGSSTRSAGSRWTIRRTWPPCAGWPR